MHHPLDPCRDLIDGLHDRRALDGAMAAERTGNAEVLASRGDDEGAHTPAGLARRRRVGAIGHRVAISADGTAF